MNGKYVGMDDPGCNDGFFIGFLYGGLDRRLLDKPPLVLRDQAMSRYVIDP